MPPFLRSISCSWPTSVSYKQISQPENRQTRVAATLRPLKGLPALAADSDKCRGRLRQEAWIDSTEHPEDLLCSAHRHFSLALFAR
ncbi:hypothetical protein HG15A2_05690 [Adhaeretor mobilis]|uniref:Uncharacterized protein n=1 Tax=Adhaeretor mobilis TaxID=1930276 RepID=A0A517MQZ1_9BACT|nr:hypothetical protein HG15A2_05690 [Adhaeretor mobilis]